MANRILIVDDQKDVSRLLRSALETIEHGLEVAEAPSGEEAILESTRAKVDLLISDFRLPGITGVELVKKFRVRNPDVKVIMITGISDTKAVNEINDLKVDAYFTKPVQMSDFLDAVERSLGLARTIVHPTEPEPVVEEPEPDHVADALIALRQDLKANGVFLFNGSGEIEAEAGALPDPNTTSSLILALMGMHNTSRKAASLLDHHATSLHIFNSQEMDGVFVAVGTTHALLVIGKNLSDAKNLLQTIEKISQSEAAILEALVGIGAVVESPPEATGGVRAYEEPFTQPVNLPTEFMQIFDQVGKKASDANSFWDSAVEKGTTFTEPDKLTYDQASRLGLTPDADKKK